MKIFDGMNKELILRKNNITKKKTIYLDIGTHFGQEYLSLFSNKKNYLWISIKRVIKYLIYKKGDKFKITDIISIFKKRKIAQKLKEDIFFIFVEANPAVIKFSDVYNDANLIFNLALKDDGETNLIKLYIAKKKKLSQGNSIYKIKKNVNEDDYILTYSVSTNKFFEDLKKRLDEIYENYNLILRLNCEGVEDSIIYSAHSFFKEKLIIISGSLKDVKNCKSQKHYDLLINYINENKLEFVFFSASPSSWKNAHSKIIDAILKSK